MTERKLRGLYRHYKGDVYQLLGPVRDSNTDTVLGVAYRRFDTLEAPIWVHPEDEFFKDVEENGVKRPRFAYLGELSSDDKPIPEDDDIDSVQGQEQQLYMTALRMVGAKHSKYELVNLVHWLLVRSKVKR